MPSIVALVDDLMALSRIREAARAAGLEVRSPRSLKELVPACRPAPRAVLFDLDRPRIPLADAMALLRAQPDLAGIPTVGFFSHVHAERARQAREAGLARAVPRSVFFEELGRILSSNPPPYPSPTRGEGKC